MYDRNTTHWTCEQGSEYWCNIRIAQLRTEMAGEKGLSPTVDFGNPPEQ